MKLTVELTVTTSDKTKKYLMNPKGILLGRAPECDVVLDSERISRQHARIYQDPFDRWIVEDLGSRNGVWVSGQRIEARAVVPGEKMTIGPFTLCLTQSLDSEINPSASVYTTTSVVNDPRQKVVHGEEKPPEALSRDRLKLLNQITDRLSDLSQVSDLYPEVCRCLADEPKKVAAILRIPTEPALLPDSPKMIACQFGDGETEPVKNRANLSLSQRVLQAVRSTQEPVMAHSTPTADGRIMLTLQDEHNPRMVFGAPIAFMDKRIDVLYVDLPSGPEAEETFDFFQAVVRQVKLARKTLFLIQAKAEAQVLERQLGLARKILSELIPDRFASFPGIDLATLYKPALWVGGDYCDVWTPAPGRLAFAVGDVAGKGLPAAMVMSNLQAILKAVMSFCTQLPEVMKQVENHLRTRLPDGMFVTLFLGVFDLDTHRLEYINAGHPLPFLIPPAGPILELGQPSNPIIGIGADSFIMDTRELEKGTGLVVFTDGVTENIAPDGSQFGDGCFREVLETCRHLPAQTIVDTLIDALGKFRMTLPQGDDITILTLINRPDAV